jgi:hypothetical protein
MHIHHLEDKGSCLLSSPYQATIVFGYLEVQSPGKILGQENFTRNWIKVWGRRGFHVMLVQKKKKTPKNKREYFS